MYYCIAACHTGTYTLWLESNETEIKITLHRAASVLIISLKQAPRDLVHLLQRSRKLLKDVEKSYFIPFELLVKFAQAGRVVLWPK
jgi:hypothetical protein